MQLVTYNEIITVVMLLRKEQLLTSESDVKIWLFELSHNLVIISVVITKWVIYDLVKMKSRFRSILFGVHHLTGLIKFVGTLRITI